MLANSSAALLSNQLAEHQTFQTEYVEPYKYLT